MFTKASITSYLNSLATHGASEATIRAYGADLRGAHAATGDLFDWPTAEVEFARWLTDGRASWAPRTTARRLGTLRSFARWSGAPGSFLASYRPPKPAAAQPHPIAEGIDGVLRMIKSTRNPKHRALCALTGLLGLRVCEAIIVTPQDFDLNDMTLRVRGKGDKARIVPVGATAWRYIAPRWNAALASERLCPYTDRGARAAITRHARNAKLSAHVSSHDMRATFATTAYRNTKNLRAVQELLGHADSKTTQVYTGISMDEMRAAAEVA